MMAREDITGHRLTLDLWLENCVHRRVRGLTSEWGGSGGSHAAHSLIFGVWLSLSRVFERLSLSYLVSLFLVVNVLI